MDNIKGGLNGSPNTYKGDGIMKLDFRQQIFALLCEMREESLEHYVYFSERLELEMLRLEHCEKYPTAIKALKQKECEERFKQLYRDISRSFDIDYGHGAIKEVPSSPTTKIQTNKLKHGGYTLCQTFKNKLSNFTQKLLRGAIRRLG